MADVEPSIQDRIGAAVVHLGYLPVGFAFLAALVFRGSGPDMLAFSIIWTIAALVIYRQEPSREFLRDHLRQARGYHGRGVSAGVCAVALTIYFSFFTWGLATTIALVAGPIALVAWMVPTWKAAWAALQGKQYSYEAVDLTGEKASNSSILTQGEAHAARENMVMGRIRQVREPAGV
jgi:hypothetical protein